MLHNRHLQNQNELDRVGFIPHKEKTMTWKKENDGALTQLIPNKQSTDSWEIYNGDLDQNPSIIKGIFLAIDKNAGTLGLKKNGGRLRSREREHSLISRGSVGTSLAFEGDKGRLCTLNSLDRDPNTTQKFQNTVAEVQL